MACWTREADLYEGTGSEGAAGSSNYLGSVEPSLQSVRRSTIRLVRCLFHGESKGRTIETGSEALLMLHHCTIMYVSRRDGFLLCIELSASCTTRTYDRANRPRVYLSALAVQSMNCASGLSLDTETSIPNSQRAAAESNDISRGKTALSHLQSSHRTHMRRSLNCPVSLSAYKSDPVTVRAAA